MSEKHTQLQLRSLVCRDRIAFTLALGSMLWAPQVLAGDLSYTYDALGRLITTESELGGTVTYSYDSAGNRTEVEVQLSDLDGDGLPDINDPNPNINEGHIGAVIILLFEE